MVKRLTFLFLFLSFAVCSDASLAQDTRTWLVVHSGTDRPTPELIQIARRLQTALARHGNVLDNANAGSLYEGQVSRTVPQITEEDTSRLSSLLNVLDAHVARNQRLAAARIAAQVRALIEPSLESWLADPEQVRKLFHACLLTASLQSNGEARVVQFEYCRILEPTQTPDAVLYPEGLIEQLAEFDLDLRARTTESLGVSADVSESVFIDGRLAGTAPLSVQLRSGEHRVRIANDPRYYRVQVRLGQATSLQINTVLDRALVTQPVLCLQYASAQLESELRQAHSLALSSALHTTDTVLVTQVDASTVRADVFDSSGSSQASVYLPLAGTRQQAVAAALALSQGISIDARDPSLPPIERWQPPETPPLSLPPVTVEAAPTPEPEPSPHAGESETPPSRQPPDWAYGLSIGGAALITAGWSAYTFQRSSESDLARLVSTQEGFLSTQERIATSNNLFGTFGLAGSGLLLSSLPFVLPEAEETPWWAWVSGGVGLVATSVGILLLVADRSCVDRYCLLREDVGWLSTVVFSHAIVALSVPLTYLLRQFSQTSNLTAELQPFNNGFYGSLRYHF